MDGKMVSVIRAGGGFGFSFPRILSLSDPQPLPVFSSLTWIQTSQHHTCSNRDYDAYASILLFGTLVACSQA